MSLFTGFWKQVALPTALITVGMGFMAPINGMSLSTVESCPIDVFNAECIGTVLSTTLVFLLAFGLTLAGLDSGVRIGIARWLANLSGQSLLWHFFGTAALGLSAWWFWQKLVPAACNVLTFPCATHMIASIVLALGALAITLRWLILSPLHLIGETSTRYQRESLIDAHDW